jgi:hypothetical protein
MQTKRKKDVLKLSFLIVSDAWFSKKSFLDSVLIDRISFEGCLWDDASLKYIYTDKTIRKQGRPKQDDEKVNPRHLNKSIFTMVAKADDTILHTAIVYSVFS